MSKLQVIFPLALLVFAAIPTGCSSNEEKFYESSRALLEIDKQWTDITTYQDVYSGLPDMTNEVTFSNSNWWAVNDFIYENLGVLGQLRFELNFLGASEELSGIKLVLAEVYDEELSLFTYSDWKPLQNYRNAEEYFDEYGDIPSYGRSLYDQWIDDTYFGPWFEAQMKRKILYERWLNILKEKGADAATMAEFKAVINKD